MSAAARTEPGVHPSRSWRLTYRRLLDAAGDRAPLLRRSLALLALAAVFQGLALSCLLPLLSAVVTSADFDAALNWLALMCGLSAVSAALRWHAQAFDYHGHMSAATHTLRVKLGKALREMPLEELQSWRSGEVTRLLLGNVDENLSYALIVSDLIFSALITPFAAALTLAAFDWRLGLLMLLVFPAILLLYRWRQPVLWRGRERLAAGKRRMSAHLNEYLQGLPILRACCDAGTRNRQIQDEFAALESLQAREQRSDSKPNVAIASVVELGLLALVFVGSFWVMQDSLDIAVLAAVMVMIVRFSEPLATFVSYTIVIELIEAAVAQIETLTSTPPLPTEEPERIPETLDIAFNAVAFHYAGTDKPALSGFSALLPERSLTAFVGPSGAGKSTIARLLLRHADPQEGCVTIGGVPLQSIPPRHLNALVSVVFQDVYLFDDTIMANLRMASPGASDTEVRMAAEAAQCLDFIEKLESGWDSRIGEIGGMLSGGERQRLSIARAILKDAPIVILDEPTSSLDAGNEQAVQQAMMALVEKKTVIVIAHRLSTITSADEILVLDDGQLVQQGQHEELIGRPGRYRDMWNAHLQAKTWEIRGFQAP